MATTSSNKSRCATCGKGAGTFMCSGCSRAFCLSHAQEHRQVLGKQMDEEIILAHDQLQQSINEHFKKPDRHPLMKQIDEWENKSIETIRSIARENRKKVLNIMNKHMDNIKTTLVNIKHQLSKAREDDDFFESDINEWKGKLEKLKQDFNAPRTISIEYENEENSFMSKMCVIETMAANERFERCLGDIKIEDNSRLIIHGNGKPMSHAAVRGYGEYSSGQHVLRFKIESIGSTKWILFAIVSKGAPIQESPYNSPTTYGWAGANQVYLNGISNLEFNGYKSEMKTNYMFEFMIDCDNRKIRFRNKQTESTYELDVDPSLCPFPWQMSYNLIDANDRLRLLQ